MAGATLVFAAPAGAQLSSAWSQFRDNAQGTSQGSVVGAQSARVASGFPVNLPVVPGGAGEAPGGVAISASGTIFAGQGATMTAYSSSGRRLWTYSAAVPGGAGQVQPSITAPALSQSGGTVYALSVPLNIFVAESSSLIAVNASNGQVRWSAPVGQLAVSSGIGQPTVTVGPGGSLYVAANIPGAPGQGPAGSPGPIASATVSSFTPYGGVNWSTTVPGPVVGGPVLDTSGNVYVSVSGTGGSNGAQVVSLNSSGAMNWQTTLGNFFTAGFLGTAPLVSPGGSTVYVATRNGSVYALGTSDGAILGTIGSASGGISGTLALSPRSGNLFGGTAAGFLTAFPSGGGSAAWSAGTEAIDNVNAPAIGADGTVYATSGNTLLAVNGTSGAPKWTFTAPGDSGSLSGPSIGPNGNVYVTSQTLGVGANQLLAFEGPG